MRPLNEGRRILRLVRMLALVGLVMVGTATGLVGWTSAIMRRERARAVLVQEQYRLSSQLLRQHAVECRTELFGVLDESAPCTNPPVKATEFGRSILTRLRSEATGIAGPSLVRLQGLADRLDSLALDAWTWRTNHDVVWADVSRQRTMNRVRQIIGELRHAAESVESQQFLTNAIEYRRWRDSTGREADLLAREIALRHAAAQRHRGTSFKDQLAEVARLSEWLGGEEQFDNLADIKCNKLKPALDALTDSVHRLEDTADGCLTPQAVEHLRAAIVGGAESLKPAPSESLRERPSLFEVRFEALRLRRDRERLNQDADVIFQEIDSANADFAQSMRERAVALTRETERKLAAGWQHALIIGGLCLAAFIWLTWRTTLSVREQIRILEEARAEAERERRALEKSMQAEQAAAVELSRANTALQSEVAARHRAASESERLHKELLDSSRLAGMAEVATDVLHNVGNVLNSVNVSASVIAERVIKSKSSSLGKVTRLLREHAADLGVFLGQDSRGRQLPAFLDQLETQLNAERQAILKETERLRKDIDHIKDVVAMQQNYAKVSGLAEPVNPAELVEDALRMNASSLARHDIRVHREFEDVPLFTVEKHKVLQILVNLVRNAKQACENCDRTDRRLTMRVTNGDEWIRISVADNGVGISPENLTRIFHHGFTTRKQGHGFGLHSGALAAREMGGSLSVKSDGVGQGTTFTLQLPRNRN